MAGADLAPLPAHLPSGLRAATEQGLAIRIDERPATVADFVRLLRGDAQPRRAPSGPSPIPEVPEGRDEGRYDVVLEDSGFLRPLIVAELRNLTGIGYGEAVRLAEEGGLITSGASRVEAERIRLQLESMGALVAVAPSGSSGSVRDTPTPAPPPMRPEVQTWQTYGGCSSFSLGCLLLLLFFLLMSSGSYIFFF